MSGGQIPDIHFYTYMKYLLLGILLTFSSCAVMFNGSKQSVHITSFTPDSRIYINGEFVGKENVKLKLKRKDDHLIHVRKEGYKTEQRDIISEVKIGWIIFDALFNWFAFITDAPTGAWNSFEKRHFVFELEKEKTDN